MKVYIAGPMTHIKHFNFPAFDEVADDLRQDATLEVVSPAELDDPAARAAAMASEDGDPVEYARITGLTWGDFLSRDVKLIADGGFSTIACLPGWERSRGARLETFVGFLNGIEIFKIVGRYEAGSMTGRFHFEAVPIKELASAWAGVDLYEMSNER